MAAAMTTATAASFPDDVVREILVRLEDAADLFRCAVTCKRWRRLVVKASFLRRQRWPDHTSMFFSGFFVREKFVLTREPATFATSFVPTSPSVFGPYRRHLECFFPGEAGDLLHNALPLATRHGLLLVRLDSPDVAVRLAVCNLLVGACHELPPLQCDWNFRKSGYAILTSVDCSLDAKQEPSTPLGYSAFFKVLIVGDDNLHRFTSGDARWRGPDKFAFVSGETSGHCLPPLRHSRAVVWRGTAHWLVRYFTVYSSSWHTIDVDAETCRASLTKIETPSVHGTTPSYDEPQLTITAGGKLSLFHMRRRGYKLEIWTRQEEDDGPSRWLRASVVELKPPDDRRSLMHLIMLGEKGGMLLVRDSHGTVYTADLETGEMKMVAGFDKIVSRRQIVPFEMDWPTFFVSRLGNR